MWSEVAGDKEISIILKTDNRSLQTAVNSANGTKGRMLRIELAGLKEKINERIIERIDWIGWRDQLADELTKDKAKNILNKEVKSSSNLVFGYK